MALPGTIDGTFVNWTEVSSSLTHTLTFDTNGTNEVLLLGIANTVLAPTNFRTVASVTGGGLTWHRYGGGSLATGALTIPPSNAGLALEVWWATAPTPITGLTVTITLSGQPSRGIAQAIGVLGCLNPSAPWDTHPSMPLVSAGSTPGSLHYSTAARSVMPVQFLATSTVGATRIQPVSNWLEHGSSGTGAGTWPAIQFTCFTLTPPIPAPPAPVASGCDPRTPTSLTASWGAVAPVNYPAHTSEPFSVITDDAPASRAYISVLGAMVGTALGNTVSYRAEYWPEPVGVPFLNTTTAATSALLTGLDADTDYDWHVLTIDTAGGESDWSNEVMCPAGGGPGPEPPPTPLALSENLISLSVSYDRGHSFGSPVSQPMGEPGEYRKSLLWRRLGHGRDAVFRLEWSSARPTALQGAWIEAEPGDGGQEKK